MGKLQEAERLQSRVGNITEVKSLEVGELRLIAADGEIVLAGEKFRLGALAVAQLCEGLMVPVGYIAKLPATLAVQNINHALKGLKGSKTSSVKLLVDGTRGVVVEVRF